MRAQQQWGPLEKGVAGREKELRVIVKTSGARGVSLPCTQPGFSLGCPSADSLSCLVLLTQATSYVIPLCTASPPTISGTGPRPPLLTGPEGRQGCAESRGTHCPGCLALGRFCAAHTLPVHPRSQPPGWGRRAPAAAGPEGLGKAGNVVTEDVVDSSVTQCQGEETPWVAQSPAVGGGGVLHTPLPIRKGLWAR